MRGDAGISPMGLASSPSLGRSGANFLFAHGPSGEIPASPLGASMKLTPMNF